MPSVHLAVDEVIVDQLRHRQARIDAGIAPLGGLVIDFGLPHLLARGLGPLVHKGKPAVGMSRQNADIRRSLCIVENGIGKALEGGPVLCFRCKDGGGESLCGQGRTEVVPDECDELGWRKNAGVPRRRVEIRLVLRGQGHERNASSRHIRCKASKPVGPCLSIRDNQGTAVARGVVVFPLCGW